MGLIFDEKSLLDGNIFQYEQRLRSQANRFIGHALLVSYYSIRQDATTVDRGLQTIDQLFGKKSPLRFNKIRNFPVYEFPMLEPQNVDDLTVEDISIEGECTILPSTIVPQPDDFFIIQHLKMRHIFQVTAVRFDSMREEGYYKITYRLQGTSQENMNNLEKQTVEEFFTELDAIGTDRNPVIRKDDFVLRGQVNQMIAKMIQGYKAMFYNERHNCFLFNNQDTHIRARWFDTCGNEFMAKHSLMNIHNDSKVVILNEKLIDVNFPIYYNNSIYNWIELGAPLRLLQKFHFMTSDSETYRDSSFARWGDGDIQVMQPLNIQQVGRNNQELSMFSPEQFSALMNPDAVIPCEFEKLLHKFIHKGQSLNLNDISLYTGDSLLNSIRNVDVYLFTPIVIYILRFILNLN